MPNVGFSHKDTSKGKIGSAMKNTWQDPDVRARRREALRLAWERRRGGAGICHTCGQPIPDEEGRD